MTPGKGVCHHGHDRATLAKTSGSAFVQDVFNLPQQALQVFSGAFAGVVLALAAASMGLVVYSVRRRWLMVELLAIRKARGV